MDNQLPQEYSNFRDSEGSNSNLVTESSVSVPKIKEGGVTKYDSEVNLFMEQVNKDNLERNEHYEQRASYHSGESTGVDIKESIAFSEKECTEDELAKYSSKTFKEDNYGETLLKRDAVVTEIIHLPKLNLTDVVLNTKNKLPIIMNSKNEYVEGTCTDTIKRCFKSLKTHKLQDRPYLNSSKNMLIAFETSDMKANKSPNSADKLLQKLTKQNKTRQNQSSMNIRIYPNESGSIKKDIIIANQKPGTEYLQLKGTLKAIIEKKRREEICRKQIEETDLIDQSVRNNVNNVVKRISNLSNSHAVNSSISVQKLNNLSSNSFEDAGNTIKNDRRNIKKNLNDFRCEANEILSNENDSKLFCSNPVRDSETQSSSLKFNNKSTLYTEKGGVSSNIEDELITLCSGKFDHTQYSINTLSMQEPVVFHTNSEGSEVESLRFQEKIDPPIKICITHTDISSDDNLLISEKQNNRKKKLTKRLHKKQIKLGFSDDESEGIADHTNDNTDPTSEQLNIEELHLTSTHIDYDSEKFEIASQLEKRTRLKNLEDFFEREAELSESEWDSADEDENNMDGYDIELGDEDKFDREQIREELEQIHARKMLDDDIKEVRKLQEMLIEDAENSGQSRSRQFKWKNFQQNFNLEKPKDILDGIKENDNDIEDEHLWRKLRFERETIINEHSSTENFGTSQFISNSNRSYSAKTISKESNLKKLNNALSENKNSSFLILKGESDMETKKMRRSFLIRDKYLLIQTATCKKNELNTTSKIESGILPAESVKPRKFVFEALRETEAIYLKRKTDDMMHHTSQVTISKKPKLEKEKCIIDTLE